MVSEPQQDRAASSEPEPEAKSNQPVVYQIRIEGHLGSHWAGWFGGVTVTLEEDGDTVITGRVVDQAALYGLLKKVRDLGMPLLSLQRVEPSQADAEDAHPESRQPHID
jgi:hypothetical protein